MRTANQRRVASAQAAYSAFISHQTNGRSHNPDDYPLRDLLANLMHWCDKNGVSFNAELESAQQHYRHEAVAETRAGWGREWRARFDKAHLRNFGIDSRDAGLDDEDIERISNGFTDDPEVVSLWFGEKHGLRRISNGGAA